MLDEAFKQTARDAKILHPGHFLEIERRDIATIDEREIGGWLRTVGEDRRADGRDQQEKGDQQLEHGSRVVVAREARRSVQHVMADTYLNGRHLLEAIGREGEGRLGQQAIDGDELPDIASKLLRGCGRIAATEAFVEFELGNLCAGLEFLQAE